MALRCEDCSDKLIFVGGMRIGRVDLELHKCYICDKTYSFDLLKGKLKEYPETKKDIKKVKK